MTKLTASLVVVFVAASLLSAAGQPPVILTGTIVTPDEVLEHGWVLVRDAKIARVSREPIQNPDAVIVETGGIIFPGLIDLHNHLGWNVLPRWRPRQKFANRAEWRNAPEYKNGMATIVTELRASYACEMNAYSEVRALVGGVTSILSSDGGSCSDGPVRNLEVDSELYPGLKSGLQPLRFAVDINTIDDRKAREIVEDLEADRAAAFLVHVGEGRAADRSSLDEFTRLVARGLLGRKTAIVHGTAFREEEFWAIHELGASLIWSPRSNVELYGETTDVRAALGRGIPVALAPDWALTGSSNMLDELRYAAQLNRTRLNGSLTSQQLVDMVTRVPARIAGIADKIGAIREGLYADLLVISGDRDRPFEALIGASSRDVRLVVIDGNPVYGAASLFDKFRSSRGSSVVSVCSTPNSLARSAEIDRADSSGWFDTIERRLRTALSARGSGLAPIAECEP